ncbi:hypothetical protein BG015_012044 [Linnemannia schmuckeri]|uniref:Uncharacterized protein n=1 Tax=Linnemannia schmuckeri TaxID=64567 RepID=A0A9P5RRU3_9FUNG|nr:hypothetical protein BG015_012044 [Linnemannia schmuckeri]
MDDELEEHFQALRSVYKYSATLTLPLPVLLESEILHVNVHQDSACKDIILWADILPLRIAAMPKVGGLDVYIDFQPAEAALTTPSSPTPQPVLSTPPFHHRHRNPLAAQPALQQSVPTKRSPQYGSDDVAISILKDFELPTAEFKPPRATPNNAIGGYHLHSHSITYSFVDTNIQSSAAPESTLANTNSPDSTSPSVNTLESTSTDTITSESTSLDINHIADLIAMADRGDMDT